MRLKPTKLEPKCEFWSVSKRLLTHPAENAGHIHIPLHRNHRNDSPSTGRLFFQHPKLEDSKETENLDQIHQRLCMQLFHRHEAVQARHAIIFSAMLSRNSFSKLEEKT